MHLPIVAGIILVAVGDELVPCASGRSCRTQTAAVLIGGPALYLIGNMLFKRVTAVRFPLSHQGGLGLLLFLVPITPALSPLLLSGATTLVLIVVAI